MDTSSLNTLDSDAIHDLLYSARRLAPHILAKFPMSEERTFAILIAATILSARKLAELRIQTRLAPKKIFCELSRSPEGQYHACTHPGQNLTARTVASFFRCG